MSVCSEEKQSEMRDVLEMICEKCKSQFTNSLKVGLWEGDPEAPSVDPKRFYISENGEAFRFLGIRFFKWERWLLSMRHGVIGEIFCEIIDSSVEKMIRKEMPEKIKGDKVYYL